MPDQHELLQAARRLQAYLERHHHAGGLLHGPDAGVRFNLRLWRFLKSALDSIPWRDDYIFIQSQGYWILANWMLYEATEDEHYRRLALEATEATLRLQTREGYWRYPLPERKHLIATVEGNWGAIGLLATYARQPHPEFLQAAISWYDFLVGRIGFQEHARGRAINYFDRPRGKVPNNSVEAVWLFLRLWSVSGESRFLEHVDDLIDFIASAQLESGELPYVVESPYERRREHYLCFQYNAFQFLKLAWSQAIRPSVAIDAILRKLARFLKTGVTTIGASATDCFRVKPEVDYYTAVLAAALQEAGRLGIAGDVDGSDRCYRRTLAQQRADGSFAYSAYDYGFLHDGRSYPRPQVMTLFHLLYPFCGDGFPRNGV